MTENTFALKDVIKTLWRKAKKNPKSKKAMQKYQLDRRRFPRVKSNLSVKISNESLEIVTQTINISASGILCQTQENIPEFTKLKIILLLSLKQPNNSGARKISKVTCEGIVVRNEPVGHSKKHNIAIFFNRLSKLATEKISQYVKSQLYSEGNPN